MNKKVNRLVLACFLISAFFMQACTKIETTQVSVAQTSADTSLASRETTSTKAASNETVPSESTTTTASSSITSAQTSQSTAETTQKSKAETSAASTTTQTTVDLSLPENREIDHEWALFLVNQNNPLSQDYSIETKTVYESYMKFKMDSRIADYMIQMISDAKKDGISLIICSAYRSYEKQKAIFDNDVKSYQAQGYSYEDAYAMTAKNVAIPGQSEHATGLAADVLSDECPSLSEKFENTKAFAWLSENAYKYGFILRYPKNKTDITGINYEPWHYRFVGLYHAKKIKDSGLCLEEYIEQQKAGQ
jgi:D-alanyl-D-alanine carboxypeptidase